MELREIQIIFSVFVLSLIQMQVNALSEEYQVPSQIIPLYFLNAIQIYFNIIN